MVALGEVDRSWRNGTWYANRPRAGIVLHNTQGSSPVTTHQSAGGWHRLVGRDGTVYRDVPDAYAAWQVAATGYTDESKRLTRWRPSWLVECPGRGVSDANYAGLGVELVGLDQTYTSWQYAALKRVLYDWQRRYGVLPINTHQQLQTDRTDPVRFDYPAFFGAPYEERRNYAAARSDPLAGPFLWPLRGVDYKDPLKGGHNFLDMTDSGVTPHPGVDLNAGGNCGDDAGALVVAPLGGIVRYVGYDNTSTRTVGWHVWIQHDGGEWGHYCHLQEAPTTPQVDQPIVTGQTIGKCGKTKGWPCEHLHWEVRRRRPDSWNYWPYNLSREQVAADYLDPFTWLLVRGTLGMGGTMSVLNDDELHNVINNGWNQLAQMPANRNSAHYKAIVDLVRTKGVCPLPVSGEFDHGLTQDGKRYNSQWFQGYLSIWKDGEEKGSLTG